jgi:hypothetical protein
MVAYRIADSKEIEEGREGREGRDGREETKGRDGREETEGKRRKGRTGLAKLRNGFAGLRRVGH